MSRSLRQKCFQTLFNISHQTILYMIGMSDTYLQTYYPLIYIADTVDSWRQDGEGHLQESALTILVVVLGLNRSLELFSSWTHIWSNKTEPAEGNTNESGNDVMTVQQLKSIDLDLGLTNAEASRRRQRYGENIIWIGSSWAKKCLRIVTRPGNMVSEVAMLTAFYHGDWLMVLAFLAPFVLNSSRQLYQQKESDDVWRSLSWSPAMKAVVVREGSIVQLAAVDLVPGDIVHISSGQVVPADIQVTRLSGSLSVDQSSITGDSTAVFKYYSDVCYVATGVLTGSAFGVVLKTGAQTFVGQTAALVKGIDRLNAANNRNIDHITSSIGQVFWGFTLAMTMILFMLGLITTIRDIVNLFTCWVVISFYANCRGSIVNMRAITSGAMIEQGAVVQSLPAVETLAAVDVLCSDLAILIEDRPVVQDPFCIDCDPEELILTACLTTPWDGPVADLDQIDNAILSNLRDYPQARHELVRYRRVDFEPFDPTTKRVWAEVESPQGQRVTCIKGAPRACLDLWQAKNTNHPDKDSIVERLKEAAGSFANKGVRTLAVLRHVEHGRMELLGLLPLVDEIRWNAAAAVQTADQLGVNIKLFTESVEQAAKHTTAEVGLGTVLFAIPGFFDEDNEDDASFQHKAFEEAACFCEVSSDDKPRILTTLQRSGHIVACTGDNVSDVPCLRTADCGIAVGTASKATMDAANILMHRPGIDAMVSLITTARRHFHAAETVLVHRAATCITLVATVFLYYKRLGQTLPAEYLYLIMCGNGLNQVIFLSPPIDEAPIEPQPSRLSSRRLWKTGIPLSMMLVVLVGIVLRICPSDDPEMARRTLYCCLVLISHWSFQLVYTFKRPWAYKQLRSGQIMLLIVDAILLLLCIFPWPWEQVMANFMAAKSEVLVSASVLSTLWQLVIFWQET